MKKYSLFVFSEPVAGKEKEYNEWYNVQHLGDLLKIPGIPSASRYHVADVQGPGAPPEVRPYLAVYDIETDDLSSVFKGISSRSGTSEMVMSDAIDLTKIQMIAYEQIYSAG
jgi:hypothetical protein